jgi:hypothetical protein
MTVYVPSPKDPVAVFHPSHHPLLAAVAAKFRVIPDAKERRPDETKVLGMLALVFSVLI